MNMKDRKLSVEQRQGHSPFFYKAEKRQEFMVEGEMDQSKGKGKCTGKEMRWKKRGEEVETGSVERLLLEL